MIHNTMMKVKVIFLVVLLVLIGGALLTLTVCCASESFSVAQAAQPLFNRKLPQPLFRGWKTYYSTEHRFMVEFPEGAAPTPVQHSGEHKGAKFSAQGYVAQESDRAWQVLVIGGLIPKFQAKYLSTEAQLGSVLDSYIDGAMENTQMRAAGGKLQTKESVRLQEKYPGRHVEVTGNGFTGEMYVYLVDGIIYQVEFTHAPSAANSSPALDGDWFFRSFYVGLDRIPFGAIQLMPFPVQ